MTTEKLEYGRAAHMADSFAFGDIPVQGASVKSSSYGTPEELVKMAQGIWKEVVDSGIGKADDVGNDKLLGELQAKHRDFAESFPITLRWMVQARVFHPKAFEKYLRKHATAKLDTREAFIELQAEYLVLLFRETRNHPSERDVRDYRKQVTAALLAEDKEFVEAQKEVEAELAAKAKGLKKEKQEALYAQLLAARLEK